MTDILFYHLTRQTLEQSLPQLLEKVVAQDMKALVKVPDSSLMNELDKLLWSFKPDSFIPHDKDGSQHTDFQKIFFTEGDDNVNGANVLALINNAVSDTLSDYDRVLYMFDGRDENIVAKAREHWKAFKDKGFPMSYWQQKEAGGWEKKA